MFKIGDNFLYHPFLSVDDDHVDERFMSIDVLRDLKETNAFLILTICDNCLDGKPHFITEIRPTPIKDGKVFINNSSVQFSHDQEKVLSVGLQNNFDFDKVMGLFDKKLRNKLLYLMNILQTLCKGEQ